jgi:hypothetical protein
MTGQMGKWANGVFENIKERKLTQKNSTKSE